MNRRDAKAAEGQSGSKLPQSKRWRRFGGASAARKRADCAGLPALWGSTSPLRLQRPQAFGALFGYLAGHRAGIDAWRRLPAGLRRGRGRSGHPERAERLLALKQLLADPVAWAAG